LEEFYISYHGFRGIYSGKVIIAGFGSKVSGSGIGRLLKPFWGKFASLGPRDYGEHCHRIALEFIGGFFKSQRGDNHENPIGKNTFSLDV
jgi:hypothetical protein